MKRGNEKNAKKSLLNLIDDIKQRKCGVFSTVLRSYAFCTLTCMFETYRFIIKCVIH